MRGEAVLFTGVAVFFAVTASVYGWLSHETAGTVTLLVSFLMSSLVAFFFWVQYQRRGQRPQDRRGAEVAETAGPLDFFPPRSAYPVLAAAGTVLTALGIVLAIWLLVLGIGVVAAGVAGFVFEFNGRSG
ncbi:cytochrome c oxidase subunit 4 [Streptomyces sp. NPDC092296]|uniref:aa3-type cytochrome oxidase subunit IV n=1 Tax=Streptomyces sp. NPDC092296 TaxID=3366012 RepID=UPI0037FADCA5